MDAHGSRHFSMAFLACIVRDLKIMWFDSKRIGEITRRERIRMPESIGSFCGVFRDETGGSVAIIADGDGAVA